MGIEYCNEAVVMLSRMLGDETAVKLLEALQNIEGIQRVIFQGPYCEPREIEVGNQKIEISVIIDTLYIEIEEESVSEQIKKVCGEILPFSYHVDVRQFKRPRVSERVSRSVKDVGLLGKDQED